jgi:tripartite-type tricarboxylate transporter receptor subunit TctC
MKMEKLFVFLLVVLSILTCVVAPSEANTYPAQAVTLIVPFPAGGRTDLTARIVAQYLKNYLGKPVVVVNKPGAGGVIGAKEVTMARPDGYTLGFFSTGVLTAQYTVPTTSNLKEYDVVSLVNIDPAALAVQYNAPWKTVKDLVDYGRKNPEKLQMGMIPGASSQIFAAAFTKTAGVQAIFVPFKGDADGAVALAGGHINSHFAVPVSYKSLIEAKKVRILGVAADRRYGLYKDLPTFKENGVDLVIGSWHAVFTPKGTPADVIQILDAALKKTMADKEVNEQMARAGLGVVYMNQTEAANFIGRDDATFKKLIQELGLMAAPQK